MSGASSRRKGHDFERQVANELREIFPGAQRGLQYRDGIGCPDVAGTPFHVECKRGKKPNPRSALAQAVFDADKGTVPIAVVRDDRADPFVVMRWSDFLDFVREWKERS